MPNWPELELPYGLLDGNHIAANALVRSAIFGTLDYTGTAARPEIIEPLALGAIKPYVITQVAGVRLSQSDADVFFWLLARAYRNGAPTGNAQVFFTHNEACAELGRSRGGKNAALLDASLQRLYDADFSYNVPSLLVGRSRLISCVERFERGAKPYDYKVTIADGLTSLLAGGEWIMLPASERDKLVGEPLAKWLHAFFASHRTVFPIKHSTLKYLTGRTDAEGKTGMQDSKWIRALEKALARVQAATGWGQCELVKTGPLTGKVVVKKGRTRRAPAKNATEE
jgi:TrfA protein